MCSLKRNLLLLLCLVLLFVASKIPVTAQDNLDDLRTEFRSGKYLTVLQPLLQYRDSATGGANFEVDYMIGITLCHRSEFKAKGCDYLRGMRQTYPRPRLDGRVVNLSQVIVSYCGPDPVSTNPDETDASAEVSGKVDSAGSRSAQNPKDIRDGIKRNLSLSEEVNVDRPGRDYRDFDLGGPRFELCRDACANDSDCKAFTYVKPSYQAANARCWLKSGAPKPAPSDCCISGVK